MPFQKKFENFAFFSSVPKFDSYHISAHIHGCVVIGGLVLAEWLEAW